MNNQPRNFVRLFLLAVFALPVALWGKNASVEKLIDAGKYDQAREVIEESLEQTPDNEYLLYNLALTHYASGDYDNAIVLWEKCRMAKDPEIVTKAMAQIGNASYRISVQTLEAGRNEDATIQLRRAQHSLQAAVDRDDGYDIAQKNYEFVSEELVQHLVQQGNDKIKTTESKWVKGERDLVLFRSALTDYEEALSIKPDDEEIQKLVDDTRKRMTDYLTQSGDKNLENAEKKLENVKEPTKEKGLNNEDVRELMRAQDAINEAVANFDDAASISPDDETQKLAEESRKKASKLMQEIAEKWQQNSEAHQDRTAERQERRDEIAEQLKDENDKETRKQLAKEDRELAQNINKAKYYASDQQQKALERFEKAVELDPENMEALSAKLELERKLSDEHEANADKNLEVAENSQKGIDARENRMDQLETEKAKADEQRQERIDNEVNKLEAQNAASAQYVADQLLNAKAELEKSTQLNPDNKTAQEKLDQTNAMLSDALEQAADMQLATAQDLQEQGKDDQAIARMEQAIKNLDSAEALSQDESQKQQLSQKMEAARQELLSERSDRADQLAEQMAQQKAQAQQMQQQQAQNQQTPQDGVEQQEAMEYKEMVQFTEDSSGEKFGKFDTRAMKSAVKDW